MFESLSDRVKDYELDFTLSPKLFKDFVTYNADLNDLSDLRKKIDDIFSFTSVSSDLRYGSDKPGMLLVSSVVKDKKHLDQESFISDISLIKEKCNIDAMELIREILELNTSKYDLRVECIINRKFNYTFGITDFTDACGIPYSYEFLPFILRKEVLEFDTVYYENFLIVLYTVYLRIMRDYLGYDGKKIQYSLIDHDFISKIVLNAPEDIVENRVVLIGSSDKVISLESLIYVLEEVAYRRIASGVHREKQLKYLRGFKYLYSVYNSFIESSKTNKMLNRLAMPFISKSLSDEIVEYSNEVEGMFFSKYPDIKRGSFDEAVYTLSYASHLVLLYFISIGVEITDEVLYYVADKEGIEFYVELEEKGRIESTTQNVVRILELINDVYFEE